MAIIFPNPNLPAQSEDWTDKVEFEIKKLDKRKGGAGGSGSDGVAGPQGPAGADGADGAQGPQGETGPQGIQGEQGFDGDTGPQGEQGLQGIQGIQGETGLTGDQGPQGEQGLQGIQGVKGDTGDQGIQGIQGIKGDTGLTGAQGIQGETGLTGEQGIQGIQGIQGVQGVKGDTGAQGPQGLTGLSAYQVAQLNGFTGTEAEWLASLEGDVGPQGEIGPAGPTGASAGQIYYMDTAGGTYTGTPITGTIAKTPVPGTQTSISGTVNTGSHLVASFTSEVGAITDLTIDAGFWLMHTYGYAELNIFHYYKLYLVDADGVSNKTLVSDGTPANSTLIEPLQALNSYTNYVPQAVIPDATKRGVIDFYIYSTANNRDFHLEFRGNTYSHLHTTLEVEGVGELRDLHDVVISSPADGALLKYDAASELWLNSNVISGGTA